MAEKGFDDAHVSDVVHAAGSSVGAFYTRFADKEALLHALYARYLEQAGATADDALDPGRWRGTGVEPLLASVVRFLVQVFREREGLVRAFVLRGNSDPAFRARQEQLGDYLADRLSALLLERSGEIAHPDPALAARFGFTMTLSTIESAVLFGELRGGDVALSDDTLARELTRAFLAYLGVRATQDSSSPAAPAANPTREETP